LGEGDARAARFLPPTAPPPHRRTVAACRADPPSIGQLCAHGHNRTSLMDFPTTIFYRKPLPSSPATSAPFKPRPRSLCAQVRNIAAARRPNAAKSCPRCWPNLCSRWINFSPMISKDSDAPLPYDPVANARNKFQVVRGKRVFGRWRHQDGKKEFVCGPLPAHSTDSVQQTDTMIFARTKVFVAAAAACDKK
jgi:hypothetical protein